MQNLFLYLHKGEIVERGTHQELLAQKGLYHMMYELQNSTAEDVDVMLKTACMRTISGFP